MMSNEVRSKYRISTYELDKIKLKIIFLIASKNYDTFTQTQIANLMDMPKTSLNYHISKLRNDGLINKNLELTQKGKRAIDYFMRWDKETPKKLRAHNIQLSINISKLPSNFFDIKHKILTPFTNQKYHGLKGNLNNCQLLFYSSNKLVVKLPDIFANDNEEITNQIHDVLMDLLTGLSEEFKGIGFDNYKICKYDSMHIAFLNSIIAEKFLIEKGRIYHTASGFAIDNSHGIAEFETENTQNIHEDIETIVRYEELARENKKLKQKLKKLGVEEND